MAITSSKIVTKGGEKILEFPSGAVRGSDEGKPRFFNWKDIQWLGYNYDTGMRYAEYNGTPFEFQFVGDPIVGEVPFQEQDWSMIPRIMINRLGGLFWRGAQKYARDNWKKGMSLARTFASMGTHMVLWWVGDKSEDHLAAIIWNATVLMWTENEIYEGRLPSDLADCGPMKGWKPSDIRKT